MTPEKPKAKIDFSGAKEPPTSLNLEQEAPPIESEEVSKDINLDPDPFDSNKENEGTQGESQVVKANISAG
ncbi:MAG: hypothetical protein KME60_14845 [Cyanomargarita calcarea GSE-NOS-MK-12-04C]|jgi:tRNA A37 threonylcarbamoyladenosine synthetase subunit TsaC/SUA5/YrdC|uniref:Uncharacterized protein n=1 Tax=Cyanomargarita calcarea GSE-NOS-MK-12-04C TaxID=2839659 RepID=A0A951QPB4_9CYAN|nr:hypothetical protein [Cyanomargarita calcarea GSE-NOS-MK-12-04C]